MAGILFVLDQRRLIDRNGVSSGGTITFYNTGTSIKATIYSDSAMTTPMPNPVVVNAGGNIPNIYLNPAVTYRRFITYADGSTDDVDPYLSIEAEVVNLQTTLASSSGGSSIGFSHTPAAAIKTVASKLQQQKAPVDAPYNAVADGTADDTTAVNTVTNDTSVNGSIFLPAGTKFRVTSWNNPYGIETVGGGQILIGSGTSSYQINDYSRTKDFIVGKEYLYRLYSRVNIAGTTMTGFIAGDSTIARGNTTITGSITGNTLTVTNAGTATLCPGTFLTSVAGVPQIVTQTSGTTFGNGTYTLSGSATIGSGTISVGNGGGFAGDPGEPQVLLPKHFKRCGVRNSISLTNVGIGGTNWSQINVIPYLGPATDFLILKYGINHVSGQDVKAEINAMRTALANIRAQTYGRVDLLTIILLGPSSTFDTAGGRTSAWYEQLRGGYEQAARDYKCCYVDLYGMFQDSTWWAGVYSDSPAVHPNGLLQQQIWAAIGNAIFPLGATQLSTGDDWISLSLQNSWAAYNNGFAPPSISLSSDGWVRLRGAIARGSGTPTAGQPMAVLPNTNYFPPYSVTQPCTTFNGSAWSTTHLGCDVGGTLAPRDAASQNTFVSLDGLFWRVW